MACDRESCKFYPNSLNCFVCRDYSNYIPAEDVNWKNGETKALNKFSDVHNNLRKTPGSGNKQIKGDIIGDSVRIEVKTTKKKSYSISTKIIDRLRVESLDGRRWILNIQFLDSSGRVNHDLTVLPTEDYIQLTKGDR